MGKALVTSYCGMTGECSQFVICDDCLKELRLDEDTQVEAADPEAECESCEPEWECRMPGHDDCECGPCEEEPEPLVASRWEDDDSEESDEIGF